MLKEGETLVNPWQQDPFCPPPPSHTHPLDCIGGLFKLWFDQGNVGWRQPAAPPSSLLPIHFP